MRPVKIAIRDALSADTAVSNLVPAAQVFSVEKATIPALPAIEVIGVSSERIDTGPLTRHALSVEVTVSHSDETGADKLLDSIVAAVRGRLLAAEHGERPIALPSGENVLVVLEATRWSISASDGAGVVRGASVSVTAEASE